LAYFVVTLVGPTVAANGIAAEREGRTWEAVLLAGLSPGMITRGKFLAAYTTISLYIVMLAPVGALPFLFGGVTATETIVAFLFLFLIALMSVAFGLAMSSKMTSMRGAIAVTLLLALPFSTLTFILFGPAMSEAAHSAWPNVPSGPPVWLPTAYSRAPFDLVYVLALFVGPVVGVVVPSWFMYEVTIANLTSPTDDRSTGLKRWFVVSVPILAAIGVAPIVGAGSAKDTMAFTVLSLGLFLLVLTFCVFLFQGDAIGPSRRVTAHWDRVRAGKLLRMLGPGVTRTAMLQLVVGLAGFVGLTVIGGALATSRRSYVAWEGPEQILLFALYASGFFVFMLGLGTYARARSSSPMVARLVLAGAVIGLFITPWVVAAIIGVLGSSSSGGWNDDLLSVASPSPAFVFFAMSKLKSTDPGAAPFASVACSFAYLVLGLVSLAAAGRRAGKIISHHDAVLANTDRLLAQEDEAVEAARIEAEAVAAHANQVGDAVSTGSANSAGEAAEDAPAPATQASPPQPAGDIAWASVPTTPDEPPQDPQPS
ncbi:MAG: ABC transporter permease, partial [Polyangiaceae bacterium]